MLLHVLGKFYRVVDSSPMGERVVDSSEETKKTLRTGALSDSFYVLYLVHPARFERATPGFEVQCSIQLSYGCRSAEQKSDGYHVREPRSMGIISFPAP